jgi:hypothetical protein
MYVTRWATVAVFCALSATSATNAQQAPPEPGKLAAPAAKYEHVWPQTLPQTQPPTAPQQTPEEWSKQEIELAQARCTALLKGLDVVALPDAPIREGTECGTPAPMRLVSIGTNPEITFYPPPVLTCDMIAALHKWLQQDVQPLARKHLGTSLVRVATMSSYSCRNAYGRAKGRLSEHGRVNALDIAAFITARGQTTMVVADWGPIAREIAAQAAAAQKQREAAEAAKQKNALPPGGPEAAAPVATQQPLRPSLGIIGLPAIGVQVPRPEAPAALGFTDASRLGGPKQTDGQAQPEPPVPAAEPLTSKAQFLRAAHKAACKIFGTVLGPEANSAHKNHFHVDMAERKHGPICE